MPEITLNSRVIRNPDMVTADMNGDIVMMSVELGQYFGLAGVAARVWELLEKPCSLQAVAQAVEAEYDVDTARCETDLLIFVRGLLTHGVVRLC